MQPIEYQTSDQRQRKSIVIKVANGLRSLNTEKFPKIYMSISSGNNKKNQVLELIIEQMYANNFDLQKSLFAVEDNI